MYCAKCKQPVRYGRGWAHVVEGDKDFHFDCYVGTEDFRKHDLSVGNESTE